MTQSEALAILKTGANVFLTGEPGSGKTHLINQYVSWLRSCGVEPAITASTGIAATHIGGYTVHSWSGIGIKTRLDEYDLDRIASNERIAKRVRRAKILIIDEVSMLAPETLSMVDAVCREIFQNASPFGGLQIILVGDFFQLPPVVKIEAQTTLMEKSRSRFAYESPAWAHANPIVCYLTEQHRQLDRNFLEILSAIRCNVFGADHLGHIEKRKIENHAIPKDAPKLFSHNVDVDRINNEMLERVSSLPKTFAMRSDGAGALVEALIKSCLSPEALTLKIGAAVMFTKNNPKEKFVNGTLGKVHGFSKQNGYPVVKTRSGLLIEVEPMDWTIEENGKILARITQMPLRLAWAITIHKSQGMSLDEAVMDLTEVFEFGQGYVALSRVTRLSGVHLLGWNERAFQVHPNVLIKDEDFREQSDIARKAFAKISEQEFQKMHDNFIRACGGDPKGGVSREKKYGTPKLRTLDVTLALLQGGKSVAEIAKARGLAQTTILSHIFQLHAKGQIDHATVEPLISPALKRALPKINSAFKELGVERLTPVFQKLRGVYSYDDLRLARILIE
jgi:ATP-dependent exoDNAse (exonuclease V) alpha subunit